MTKLQSLKNKRGEVNFRRKFSQQLKGAGKFYWGVPDKKEYLEILRDRVRLSRKIFKDLQKKGVPLSPFVEIGAERGQRAVLLVNEFKAQGFATDISYHSLKSADSLIEQLGFKKMPIRITCDVYHLPFKPESFPFVFCFQTLHHFPDPKPVIKEIKRIIRPGGYFYFSEEPVKQTFNLNLWRRDHKLKPWEALLKYIGILPFLSTIGKSEVSEGILEEAFDLKTWRQALDVFDKVDVTIKAYPFGPSFQGLNPSLPKRILLDLLGGGISALCRKKGVLVKDSGKIMNSLVLPKGRFLKNDVAYLLPKNLMSALYPEVK